MFYIPHGLRIVIQQPGSSCSMGLVRSYLSMTELTEVTSFDRYVLSCIQGVHPLISQRRITNCPGKHDQGKHGMDANLRGYLSDEFAVVQGSLAQGHRNEVSPERFTVLHTVARKIRCIAIIKLLVPPASDQHSLLNLCPSAWLELPAVWYDSCARLLTYRSSSWQAEFMGSSVEQCIGSTLDETKCYPLFIISH